MVTIRVVTRNYSKRLPEWLWVETTRIHYESGYEWLKLVLTTGF